VKIDRLKDIIKRYPNEYAEGYNACKYAKSNYKKYNNPYTSERRIAWARGWGDRLTEEMKDV